ncbi:hypothetical protein CROQUDRAFT_671985 [Cronartium quercuum f. sp. fusiforme G11]|uniref:Natural resistance-associated macrophage protein n=1 Tax=Cronartium quercuum f. sp. fusiforme G11 TaxID=708437 RepID=A0A9P6NJ22_9BASI|nr:hypothetical protein CROQUDRAFT_671985 [Cronartium quercuum f. sp. fusiforme G11]
MSANLATLYRNDGQEESRSATPARAPGILGVLKRHSKFIGPGVVASVTFYDPGNWATDLQAGSKFGSSHLFVLLIAISFAVYLQVLACRLGYISGKDLSQNCRTALHSRPKKTKLWRWLGLYPLWLLLEIGVIFADVGELLGSAIAYNLLIPKLPLWGGVLLTFFDVFFALIFFRKGKESKKSMKIFEIVITIVVMTVVIASLILLFKVKPDWTRAMRGFLPSLDVGKGTGLYTAIGIIGATVGPHSILLGSSLATMERDGNSEPESEESLELEKSDTIDSEKTLPSRHNNRIDHGGSQGMIGQKTADSTVRTRSLTSCRSYLAHATFDIAASLFTLPLIVNAAILLVASTTFFYVVNLKPFAEREEADIEAVYALLKIKLGPALAFLFAFSLLLSGQAASLTITMAGQSLSAGFLAWETNPLLRRLITRTIGIIPSAIVAVLLGKEGVNKMLIASQVAISVVLPFSIIPLAFFTGQESVMSINCSEEKQSFDSEIEVPTVRFRADSLTIEPQKRPQGLSPLQKYYKNSGARLGEKPVIRRLDTSSSGDMAIAMFGRGSRTHSFANPLFIKITSGFIVIIITLANIYAIIQAAQDKT